jgi:hypothetical protein
MSEKNSDVVQCLHGLELFFEFQKEKELSEHLHEYVSQYYSEDPYPAFKRIITFYKNKLKTEEDFQKSLNFAVQAIKKEIDIIDLISCLLRIWPDNEFLKSLHKYGRTVDDISVLIDLLSKSQVQSKIWLVTELAKIKTEFKNVLILAGWYGQLIKYFDSIEFDRIKIVEIDQAACLISDEIFNLGLIQDYKVKAVHANINDLTLTKKGYEFHIENFKNTEQRKFNERFLPDLIINTSAEHMTEAWFNSIRFKEMESNPIVVIQSNNLFDIEEHVNCVYSIDHMKKKFPMREILYEGELQLQGYKRIMLIGRP